MNDRGESFAMSRPFVMLAMMAATVIVASQAFAQQPAPAPAPKGTAQPKAAQPKAAQPKGAAPAAPEQPGAGQPQVTFSPWTKLCPAPNEANAKKVCFTGRDGRVDSGMPVVAAVLIEAEGEQRKLLRITLPLGMALAPGTRVVIDQGQPITAPYVICLQNGCMADYEASQELINNMKKGQGLVLQGINGGGQAVSISLPLADFGKAHDGPAMSDKEFDELQKKLQAQRPPVN
jgi:invasion protein IalB